MAHGRYPVSAYDLVRNHQTICSVDALKAPTRRCLAPALSTAVSRPDPRCTVAASQISIAPPDRGAHSPAVSFPGGFRTHGPAAFARVESSMMGPASETRHRSGP